MMTTHSPFSPSARHRWGVCPASVRLSVDIPSKPGGSAAIDGTHTHTVLETAIKLGTSAKVMIGQTLIDHEGSFVVDTARAERVDYALDYIDDATSTMPSAVVIAERKVDPAYLLQRGGCYGTVDVQIAYTNGTLEIIDYKDGIGEVEAVDNPQLEQYAIAALSMAAERGEQFNLVKMTIIQPKLRVLGKSNAIKSWVIDAHTLMTEGVQRLRREVDAVLEPDAPSVAGDKQCRYCPAAGNCPTKASRALAGSGVVFDNLDIASQSADKNPLTMSNDQLAEIMEGAPLIRQLIADTEVEIIKRIEAGQVVKGFKMVEGRGIRKWNADDEVIANKLVKMGIPKASLYKSTLVTAPQVEKLTWTKRDGTTSQLSPKQLQLLHGEYVTKMIGKPTLVPESDDRKSIANAVNLFSPVVESLPLWLS